VTLLAPHLTAFLRDRLAVERGASPRTCDTYAYAFKLLLEYAWRRLRVAPIKTFMRFVEHRVPSALDQVHRILAIPSQRVTTRLVRHLRPEEYQPLLDAPAPETRLGIRDRAILHLAIAGGFRASELLGLRIDDLRFDGRYVEVHVRGKGRKERVLLLWREVARSVRQWLSVRGASTVPEIILTARGDVMTRAGLEYVVKKHARAAAQKDPSLQNKKISPHVLRHTCAVNMLRATGDTRKVALWLGHASPATTDAFYLPVDPTEKLEALASMQPPALRPGRFRPTDRLLESIRIRKGAEAQASETGYQTRAKGKPKRPKRRRR
jgi:integrase/recombinase XerD